METPVNQPVVVEPPSFTPLEMRMLKKTLFQGPQEEKVEVLLRLCPILNDEESIVADATGNVIEIHGPKDKENIHEFSFDSVFDESTTQEDIFKVSALPLVARLFKGEDAVLFAYGATGSGKTFTIQGKESNPGLVPRTLQTIFDSIPSERMIVPPKLSPELAKVGADSGGSFVVELGSTTANYSVCLSVFEIYNERIFDLLSPQQTDRVQLQLKETKSGDLIVQSLTEMPVCNYKAAQEVVETARRNRQVKATKLNQDSSRSHFVFDIKITQMPYKPGTKILDATQVKFSKLSVIDLAGSERALRTQNTGDRLNEASNINNSLMILRRCMEALRYNQSVSKTDKNAKLKVVPFRESKLTHLLRNNFYGKNGSGGKVVMIVALNPSASYFDETMHVLNFAALAKTVKTSNVKKSAVTKAKPFQLSTAQEKEKKPVKADTASETKRRPAMRELEEEIDTGVDGMDVAEPETPLPMNPPPKVLSKKTPPRFDDADAMDDGTPAKEDDSFELDPEVLLAEVDSLHQQIAHYKKRCVEIEMEVRSELTEQMASQLEDAERQLESHFQQELRGTEANYKHRIEQLQKRNDELVERINFLEKHSPKKTAPPVDAMDIDEASAPKANLRKRRHSDIDMAANALAERVKALEAEKTQRKSDAETMQETIEALRAQVAELNTELAQKDSSLAHMLHRLQLERSPKKPQAPVAEPAPEPLPVEGGEMKKDKSKRKLNKDDDGSAKEETTLKRVVSMFSPKKKEKKEKSHKGHKKEKVEQQRQVVEIDEDDDGISDFQRKKSTYAPFRSQPTFTQEKEAPIEDVEENEGPVLKKRKVDLALSPIQGSPMSKENSPAVSNIVARSASLGIKSGNSPTRSPLKTDNALSPNFGNSKTYVPTPPKQPEEGKRKLLMPSGSNIKKKFAGVALTEKDAEDSPKNVAANKIHTMARATPMKNRLRARNGPDYSMI